LVTSITAYLSADGQVHRNLEEAEFCDYNLTVRQDIERFMAENGISDPNGTQATLLAKWELWRLGGYAGWLAGLKGEAPVPVAPEPPAQAELPHLSIVDSAPSAEATSEPARHPRTALASVASEKSAGFRRRVAVVALPVIHHRTIEKEFGNEFKLMLLDYANAMPKLESLKLYHKVLVMTRHAHPKTVQLLRGIGQEPMLVNGDIDNLRETLTAMYLATAA
jgi:hypothetical protein